MKKRITFKKGDRVVWKDKNYLRDREKDVKYYIKYYGRGSFRVREVIKVPGRQQKTTGHHQWLMIRTKQGIERFSGWWFKIK